MLLITHYRFREVYPPLEGVGGGFNQIHLSFALSSFLPLPPPEGDKLLGNDNESSKMLNLPDIKSHLVI